MPLLASILGLDLQRVVCFSPSGRRRNGLQAEIIVSSTALNHNHSESELLVLLLNTVCNLGLTSSLDDGSKRELERMFGTKLPFSG